MSSDFSDICSRCGMCCDGTLFGKANIKNTTDRTLAKSLNLIVSDVGDKQFFELPCHYFDKKCTRYTEAKPRICSAYFCQTLISVIEEKSTREQAEVIIDSALGLKRHFEQTQKQFPRLSGKSIFQVKQVLYKEPKTLDEKRQYRREYAQLYLIGIKLFPLLKTITKK